MSILIVVVVHGLHILLTAVPNNPTASCHDARRQIGPTVHQSQIEDRQSVFHQAHLVINDKNAKIKKPSKWRKPVRQIRTPRRPPYASCS